MLARVTVDLGRPNSIRIHIIPGQYLYHPCTIPILPLYSIYITPVLSILPLDNIHNTPSQYGIHITPYNIHLQYPIVSHCDIHIMISPPFNIHITHL